MGEHDELKNRFMHVDFKGQKPTIDAKKTTIDAKKTTIDGKKTTIETKKAKIELDVYTHLFMSIIIPKKAG